MPLTITEALAEIKTIARRIEKKREFILGFLHRQDGLRDPLLKDGGSSEVIKRERQSVADLELRIISLRRGIQRANDQTEVTVSGVTMSIADWLVWRRDISTNRQHFLATARARLANLRETAKRQGSTVVPNAVTSSETKPTDYVVNIDEAELAREIETLEQVLGTLDGQLSLKNATVQIVE